MAVSSLCFHIGFIHPIPFFFSFHTPNTCCLGQYLMIRLNNEEQKEFVRPVRSGKCSFSTSCASESGKYSLWKISRPASSNWYILLRPDVLSGDSPYLFEKERCATLLHSNLSSFPYVHNLSCCPSGKITPPKSLTFWRHCCNLQDLPQT